MNLLAGSTGFLGNDILKELGGIESQTLALSRRVIPNLPDNADELIVDFDYLSELEIPIVNHVYLSLGYPLYYHNVMGENWILNAASSYTPLDVQRPNDTSGNDNFWNVRVGLTIRY